MKKHIYHTTKKQVLFITIGILVVAGLGYGTFFSYTTYKNLQSTKQELQVTTQNLNNTITLLQENITKLTQENENITSLLTEQQKNNLALEKEKKRNAKTINKLEKLTTIDPELLKKYSKVFFLSENYSPPELEDIDPRFKIYEDKELQILKQVAPFLQDMLEAADADGINLRIISSFRSFETQMKLKSNYTVTYGVGANAFSADQGYSEHQLGTTLDFGTPQITGAYMSFEKTPEFTWLKAHAHKYGFILSYPKGNSYYQYEPWHWRFVGKDLASDLYDDGKFFYELDQREIDEYLIKIFD